MLTSEPMEAPGTYIACNTYWAHVLGPSHVVIFQCNILIYTIFFRHVHTGLVQLLCLVQQQNNLFFYNKYLLRTHSPPGQLFF